MPEQKQIKIVESKIWKNRLLLSKLSYSRSLKKYFQSRLFFAEYDRDIQNVSMSILQIPVISNIITLAWAVGADVYVKELDRTYLESLNKIKSVMTGWYPTFSFPTDIHVEEIVSNKFSNERYGLLFSGGVDSHTSYIRNKSKKPILIMVWGADIPLVEEEFWRKITSKYEKFAKDEKLDITFIKTNMRQFINESSLVREFGCYLPDSSWWGGVSHGMQLLGLCAPITQVKHIGTLLIAASCSPEHLRRQLPWGSHPLIDNEVSWANVKVMHDAWKLSRQEKIRYVLRNYINDYGRYPVLRVCYSQFRDLNCGKCEKCLRTITGLVLENVDPNKCGFNIDTDVFDFVKQYFTGGRAHLYFDARRGMWKDIQTHIPEKLSHNLYDSGIFFEWLRDFNISRNAHRKNIRWWLLYILDKLPDNVKIAITKFSVILRGILKRKYPFF